MSRGLALRKEKESVLALGKRLDLIIGREQEEVPPQTQQDWDLKFHLLLFSRSDNSINLRLAMPPQLRELKDGMFDWGLD